MHVLIVEDQKYPLEALIYAVDKVAPKHDLTFDRKDVDIAKWYDRAQELLRQKQYDLVLLDHRLPYQDTGDLEETDMRKFSEQLEGIGYSLLPLIKRSSPKALIIGTSSLSGGELHGVRTPDHKMSKMWGDAEKDLDRIMSEAYRK